MATIGKIQEIAIEKLIPYARNAKKHNDDQLEKIGESIKEFGFVNPCLIDKDFNVIAGHGRIMAAERIGMDKVPCLFIEGLTEAQRKAYILADNKLGELAEWDTILVSQELESLRAEGIDIEITGFTVDDIIFTDDMEPEIDEKQFQEVVGNTTDIKIHRGDIWQLGDHILMCGDSTSPDDVAKLLGGGDSRPIANRPTIWC